MSNFPTPNRPADHVDRLVSQWAAGHPELDVSPLEVTGRLLTAARLLAHRHELLLASFGLKRGEFDVLVSLFRAGPPYEETPTALSASLLLSTSAMTNRLDRLQRDRLITREPDHRDRRGIRVRLSGSGRSLVERALRAHLASEHELIDELPPGARVALEGALRSLLCRLEETTGAGGGPELRAPR